MKQNKKETITLRNCLNYLIDNFSLVFWMFILILVAYILTPPLTTNSYCKQNPDKCVLEPTEIFLNSNTIPTKYNSPEEYCKNHPVKYIPKDYCQFRKKTQAELDIDDCNSNPSEDELCKCEEYSEPQETMQLKFMVWTNAERFKTIPEGRKFIEEKLREMSCHNSYLVYEVTSNGVTKRLEQEQINDLRFYNISYTINFVYPNFYECYAKESTCLSSRPKTEWELHPNDYVVETKQVCVEESDDFFTAVYYSDTKESKYVNRCLRYENQTTYRLKNECEKGNKDWIEENIISCCDGINQCNIDINNPLCLENKTICREKTEAEKLMDKDCDHLLYTINSYSSKHDFSLCDDKQYFFKLQPNKNTCSIYFNARQAFREKGCQI